MRPLGFTYVAIGACCLKVAAWFFVGSVPAANSVALIVLGAGIGLLAIRR